MSDIYFLKEFKPLRPNFNIQIYLENHSNALETCIQKQLYSSGFYHLHLIYMTIIYFHVGRIIIEHPEQAEASLIGFGERLIKKIKPSNQTNGAIDTAKLYEINERQIFKYFSLIKIDKNILNKAKDLVDKRNVLFHANPQPNILTSDVFDEECEKYIHSLKEITDSEKSFIQQVYDRKIRDIDANKKLDENDLQEIFPIFSKYELSMLSKIEHKKKVSGQILKLIEEM